MQIRLKSHHSHKQANTILKNPTRVIVTSFALIIALGTFLLMMPFSSRTGEFTKFMDAFFTATSATCVTGLIVVDTYQHFSTLGQIIVLCLIQLGGLGLVTITTFFHVALRKKIGLKTRQLAQESINSSTPENTAELLLMLIKLTLGIELVGAVILSSVFIPQFGLDGIFISIFLSVSSYCNAGFDILGRLENFSSLVHYFDNPIVLITIVLLITAGGLGFIVWFDLYQYRKTKHLNFHTKIVLVATLLLSVVGTLFILISEWSNPNTIGQMNTGEKILNSLFLSVSCRTAGFNTFDLGSMYGTTKLACIIWMFIGAAPGSTGGGVKITTFTVLIMTVVCVLRGKGETLILGRKVDKNVIYKSLTIIFIGMVAVFAATAFIGFTIHSEGTQVQDINALFESVSAFSTAGLSAGVTAVANLPSRVILTATMFLGRVGPVSLALSLAARTQSNKHHVYPDAKIIVG